MSEIAILVFAWYEDVVERSAGSMFFLNSNRNLGLIGIVGARPKIII